jgi:hypothetical protein
MCPCYTTVVFSLQILIGGDFRIIDGEDKKNSFYFRMFGKIVVIKKMVLMEPDFV